MDRLPLTCLLTLLCAASVFGNNFTGDKWGSSGNETCADRELCKEEVRVLTGAFSLLDVSQGLICAVASLIAATSVLMLLLFLLLSRLTAMRRD